jgi:hypothetical protein
MNTTFALNTDLRTIVGVLAGLTESRRNCASRVQDMAQDPTVRNEECHSLENVGFSLALLAVVGLGSLCGFYPPEIELTFYRPIT